MEDLYNIKAFLLRTKTKATLDHETSSKKPFKVDFITYPTPENKFWMSMNTYNTPTATKTQTTFGISLLLGEKYRVKTKLYDFRSPKISLSSSLPLLDNVKYFIKFSPRNEEKDNVFTLIGFAGHVDNFRVTSGLLIQNNYYILSKVSFYPWKGLSLRSFVNYDLSNFRIFDYAGMIGYEYKNCEVFFRQDYQDKNNNANQITKGFGLGFWYKFNQRLRLAVWLRSRESKDKKSTKEKLIVGGHYQIDDNKLLKLKIGHDLIYSVLYKHQLTNNLSLSLRLADDIRNSSLLTNGVGLNVRYCLS